MWVSEAERAGVVRFRMNSGPARYYDRLPLVVRVMLGKEDAGAIEFAAGDESRDVALRIDARRAPERIRFSASTSFVPNEVDGRGDVRRISIRVTDPEFVPSAR